MTDSMTIGSKGLKLIGHDIQVLWAEAGTTMELTVFIQSNSKVVSPVSWSHSRGGNLPTPILPPPGGYLPPGTSAFSFSFTEYGFGGLTLTATVTLGPPADQVLSVPLAFFVGSAIVAGADGKYWQLYSNGSVVPVSEEDVEGTIKPLVGDNAIVADLTNRSTITAVTCYVLNLKSFIVRKR